jgi:RNA polymerase sigma-70 factor, ECF subfamily
LPNDSRKQHVKQWYQLYSDDIYKYVYFMIGDREQAKDLTQDTFLRAFDKYVFFEEENSKGWLFRIARNLTIDYLRKKKPLAFFFDTIPALKSTDATPEQIYSFNETEQEIFQALEKIKRSYRDVIVLRKIEGFSIQETSEILGWHESKVKINLLRGMKALNKQLEKEAERNEIC